MPTHSPNEPAAPKRTAPLTRDEIMHAALAIVDEEGLARLSMRNLARRLGVEAMSLYHHVASKDALLTGVVETVMQEMDLAEPIPEDWMGVLEAMLVSFRRVLAAHPNTVPILMTRPLASATTADYVEAPLRVLGQAGMTPAQAGELYHAAIAYTLGHAFITGLEPATPEGSPIRAHDAAERYPAIAGSGVTAWHFDEAAYLRAVRVIVAGFADVAACERDAVGGTD